MIFLLQKLSVCFPFTYRIEFKHLNVVFGVFLILARHRLLVTSQIWAVAKVEYLLSPKSLLYVSLPLVVLPFSLKATSPPSFLNPRPFLLQFLSPSSALHIQVYLGAMAGPVPEPQNKQISQ